MKNRFAYACSILFTLFGSAALGAAPPASQPSKPALIEVKKIWDAAPHNAFTDLIRFQDRWYCTFREGKGHVSPDGALRLLASDDGEKWESVHLFRTDTGDARDAKLAVTPDGKLMLLGCIKEPDPVKHRPVAWFSDDGRNWSDMRYVGEDNYWLWRVTFHRGVGYGIGYAVGGEHAVRLYKSTDNGQSFQVLVPRLDVSGYANEHALVFLPDDTAVCLLRRDPAAKPVAKPGVAATDTALLGTAKPPYTGWTWKDLGLRFGGPALLRHPDGQLLAGGRVYKPSPHTAICRLDLDAGRLTEVLPLPSGGDTSYPGMVLHEGVLWTSYYSSHEGKTSIHLAKVKLPRLER